MLHALATHWSRDWRVLATLQAWLLCHLVIGLVPHFYHSTEFRWEGEEVDEDTKSFMALWAIPLGLLTLNAVSYCVVKILWIVSVCWPQGSLWPSVWGPHHFGIVVLMCSVCLLQQPVRPLKWARRLFMLSLTLSIWVLWYPIVDTMDL